jgi:hypothetical protein
MTPDDSPPCGHGDTHPSDCAPWLDWTSALLRAERARRDAHRELDVERLRHALHSADLIHPIADGGYCHCADRAAAIAREYAQSEEAKL